MSRTIHSTTGRRGRRLLATTALTAVLTGSIVGPAAAFEPPADPAEQFSCDDGPVAGHPGHRGSTVALGTGNTVAAWNATEDFGGPLAIC